MKKPTFVYLMLALLMGTSLVLAQPVQQNATLSGIDLIIAIDNSGSMYKGASSRTQSDGIDMGLRVVSDNNYLPYFNQPTDPSNVRYDLARFVLDWFADFSGAQTNRGQIFDNWASVVGFDDSASTLLTWTRLNQPPNNSPSPTVNPTGFTIPDPPSGVANSNYIALYEQIKTLYDLRTEPNRQRLVIIISDSLPCAPDYQFDNVLNGQPGFDRTCANNSSYYLPRHLSEASAQRVSGVEYNLFFLVDPAVEALYSNYRWSDIAGNVQYADEDGIYGIGEDIINLLMDKSAQVIGGGDRSTLGLSFANASGTLTVPPYQQLAELTLLTTQPPTNTPDFSYSLNNNSLLPDTIVFNPTSGAFRRVQFNNPPPGNWEIESTQGVSVLAFAAYKPAPVGFNVSTTSTSVFDPVRLYYQIGDSSDSLDTQYGIDFDVQVRIPDIGTFPVEMKPTEDGLGWEGEFVPTVARDHIVTINAVPAANWAGQLSDTSFLIPENASTTVKVNERELEAQIFASVPELAPITSRVGDDLSITLAQGITITLGFADNMLSFDDRFSAVLSFAPLETASGASGDACLSREVALELSADKKQLSTGELQFANTGDCQLQLQALITDERLLGENSIPIFNEDDLVKLHVANTIQLTFELRDNDAEKIDDKELEVNDRESMPEFFTGEGVLGLVYWPYTTTSYEVVMLDQNRFPIWPQFASTVAPDTIPFTLLVLNDDDENLAETKNIQIQPTDNRGVYGFTLSGLEPGIYTIQVELNELQLNETYQYAPDLFAETGRNIQVSTLVVKDSPADDLSRYLVGGLFGILAVWGAGKIGLRYTRGRNPLRNHLIVYESADYIEEHHVWHYNFNDIKPRRNSYKVPISELPMWRPPIVEVEARTGGKTDGSAIITVRISDSQSDGNKKVLMQKQLIQLEQPPVYLYQDQAGRVYSIAIRRDLPRSE